MASKLQRQCINTSADARSTYLIRRDFEGLYRFVVQFVARDKTWLQNRQRQCINTGADARSTSPWGVASQAWTNLFYSLLHWQRVASNLSALVLTLALAANVGSRARAGCAD